MKFWLLFAALAVVSPAAVAQVSVEVRAEPNYLPGEELELEVRITNLSGQTIQLGAREDWLTFAADTPQGFVVPQLRPLPLPGELALESSATAIRRVDISSAFDLSKPGRYQVTATLRVPGWENPVHSPPSGFDIMSGVTLWEQSFGVPLANGGSGQPEVRKYALQKAPHRKQTKLYVRVSDAGAGKTFGVFRAGPTVSFSRIEKQLDAQSNLHLLFQTGARGFLYCVINPDSKLLLRQTHDIVQRSLPVLGTDREGRITVVGGARRPDASDFPAPVAAVTNANPLAQP